MRDVAIVGGGPGGLHAATLLAQRGFDVAVFEEHASSGNPVHCTGVLASEAFVEFDLPRAVILNTLRTARFHSPSGVSVSYTTEQLEAVAIDRLQLDQQLHHRAIAAGAAMLHSRRVEDVTLEHDGVTIRLKGGDRVRARTCVLACGANYALQRRLGLGLPSLYLQSAQLEVPAGRSGDVELYFGRRVAPNGFAWVVPIERPGGSYARVGLMCEQDSGTHFKRFLERIAASWGIEVDADAASPRQKLLPLSPLPRTYGARLLAVGDAGGIVKATTGGGIYFSLLSASLAVGALEHAFRRGEFDAATLSRYERSWRRRLGAEIRAQQRLRAIAHRMTDPDIEALFELARTDGVMPIVREKARFNQHRGLILALLKHPPARRVLFRRLRGRVPNLIDVPQLG
jgi:digeranylgeranylglycerophospholipid reductase